MNILFVCSKNEWRSRTAETIFKDNGQHPVRSAGTSAKARVRLSQSLLDWAQLIFVMEHHHKERMLDTFYLEEQQLVVLDIPDEYTYMDTELIEMLQEASTHWL